MTLDGKDRVVIDTGIIMAVIAYRSKSLFLRRQGRRTIS